MSLQCFTDLLGHIQTQSLSIPPSLPLWRRSSIWKASWQSVMLGLVLLRLLSLVPRQELIAQVWKISHKFLVRLSSSNQQLFLLFSDTAGAGENAKDWCCRGGKLIWFPEGIGSISSHTQRWSHKRYISKQTGGEHDSGPRSSIHKGLLESVLEWQWKCQGYY